MQEYTRNGNKRLGITAALEVVSSLYTGSMAKQYWLMKSEPDSYGIGHLKKDKQTAWTGVRNFLARNYMRDGMNVGDGILFYHSSCKEPGVYGLATVASAAYPDPTQFDPKGHYFEKRATKEKPVWYLVDVGFVKELARPVLIRELREDDMTCGMETLRPGSRLSITPVTEKEYERVLALAT
jgi:predicted RNA-binding protein with PUA-like domain